jgi:hypothetical protein
MVKADLNTLKHYTDNGIKLIGIYESGAAIASDADYTLAFTSCPADIEALHQGKGDLQGRAKGIVINCFRFIPKDNNYLIIDIDRNHADGIDGLELFYKFFEDIGKPRNAMPQAMRDIEGGSFPCYTSTPSGGFHLYFKFDSNIKLKQNLAGKGIDIIYTKQATAAGSIKANKAYILHGNLNDAPFLYGFVREHITQIPTPPAQLPQAKYNVPTSKNFSGNLGNKGLKARKEFNGKYAWEKIVEFTDKDGFGSGGRNDRAYSLALKAAKCGWTLQETISQLMMEANINELSQKEIENTAKSAYKKAFPLSL